MTSSGRRSLLLQTMHLRSDKHGSDLHSRQASGRVRWGVIVPLLQRHALLACGRNLIFPHLHRSEDPRFLFKRVALLSLGSVMPPQTECLPQKADQVIEIWSAERGPGSLNTAGGHKESRPLVLENQTGKPPLNSVSLSCFKSGCAPRYLSQLKRRMIERRTSIHSTGVQHINMVTASRDRRFNTARLCWWTKCINYPCSRSQTCPRCLRTCCSLLKAR